MTIHRRDFLVPQRSRVTTTPSVAHSTRKTTTTFFLILFFWGGAAGNWYNVHSRNLISHSFILPYFVLILVSLCVWLGSTWSCRKLLVSAR